MTFKKSHFKFQFELTAESELSFHFVGCKECCQAAISVLRKKEGMLKEILDAADSLTAEKALYELRSHSSN